MRRWRGKLSRSGRPVPGQIRRPRSPLLVRGESLAAGMSDYLITQLKATPNIESGSATELPAATAKPAWKP